MNTGDLIKRAEKYASNYDGDDRECIKTDVLNGFYQGAAYAQHECAKLLELSTQELLLLAGEMTAQELRTVKAVLKNRAAAIRSGE